MRVRGNTARLVPLLAVTVVLLLTTGCAPEPAGGARPPAAAGSPPAADPAGPAPSRGGARSLDGTTSVAEFRKDVNDAARLAHAYWSGQLGTTRDGFRPVRRVLPYQNEGEVSCGAEPLGLRNAAYCADGDFIAYDANWAVESFRQIGDAFVFYLLGHEYAHGIQVRLGIRSRFTIQQELQADCMAGAYIGDLVRTGELTMRDGDLDEFRAGLLAVGDDPGQPWFAEGAHGTAEQRTAAFFNGYERSLEPCDLG